MQTPGILLANLLDMGDMDRAVEATFGNALQDSVWYAGFFAAFSVGFYFLMFYLVRYSRLSLASASRNIVPLLPDGAFGFRRIFGLIHARLPIFAIVGSLGVYFVLFSGSSPPFGLARTAENVAQLLVITFTMATVLWTFFTTLWGLHRLGKEPLVLKPYYEDPMLGLRPLGSMSVSTTTVYFGAITLVLVVSLAYPQPPAFLAFLLVLVVFGAVLFVLPLLGIHRRMLEEKRRVEQVVRLEAARYARTADPSGLSVAPTLADLQQQIAELRQAVAHERAARDVATLPTWPFDSQVTGRMAAITLTGVVAVLGRAAVDYFLMKP